MPYDSKYRYSEGSQVITCEFEHVLLVCDSSLFLLQMTVKISENHLVSGHASVLQNELDHSRKVSEETSERLATTAYDLDNLQKMKVFFVS